MRLVLKVWRYYKVRTFISTRLNLCENIYQTITKKPTGDWPPDLSRSLFVWWLWRDICATWSDTCNTIVIVESARWLLMAWCLFGARASAATVLTWAGHAISGPLQRNMQCWTVRFPITSVDIMANSHMIQASIAVISLLHRRVQYSGYISLVF